MKGGSVSGVCKGYITKVVWRAILALMGAWGPHKLVISDTIASETVTAVMSLGCTTMPSLSAAESRKVLYPAPMGVHYFLIRS